MVKDRLKFDGMPHGKIWRRMITTADIRVGMDSDSEAEDDSPHIEVERSKLTESYLRKFDAIWEDPETVERRDG